MEKESTYNYLGECVEKKRITLLGQRAIELHRHENGYLIIATTGIKKQKIALSHEAIACLIELYEKQADHAEDAKRLLLNVDMPESERLEFADRMGYGKEAICLE